MLEHKPMKNEPPDKEPSSPQVKKEIFRFYDLDGNLVVKNTINGRTYRFIKHNWEAFDFPIEIEREHAKPVETSLVPERYKEAQEQLTQTIGSEVAIEESKIEKHLFLLLYPHYLEREFLNLSKEYSADEQNKISDTLEFCKNKHAGQFRIHNAPYYTHPLHAALCAMEDGASADDILVLLLHDTLEDTSTTKEELAQTYSAEIASKVSKLSKKINGEKVPIDEYEKGIASDSEAIRSKGYDRLSNIISLYFVPEWSKHDIYIEETESKILPMVQPVDPDLAKRIQRALDYVKKNVRPTDEEAKRIADLQQIRELKSELSKE